MDGSTGSRLWERLERMRKLPGGDGFDAAGWDTPFSAAAWCFHPVRDVADQLGQKESEKKLSEHVLISGLLSRAQAFYDADAAARFLLAEQAAMSR